ncbi:MAG: glycosyltransferase family 4 protein [Candidatus Hydrothermarchaeota archaeon]|nr:glycosyltransferase family 4 protein [Candidatus Hydrothermarchaeota archaeon]
MASEYPPLATGSGRHAYELTRALAKDNFVHVITPRVVHALDAEEQGNLSISRVRHIRKAGVLPLSFSLTSNLLARKIMKKQDIDIICGHQWDSVIFPFPRKIPFVLRANITAVGTWEFMKSVNISAFQRLMYRSAVYLDRQVCRRADKIVAVSSFLANELRKYDIENEKIETVLNGVDIEGFNPKESGEEVRKKHGLEDKKVLLYVGRISPQKGIEYLLEALPAVVQEHQDVKLLVVGGPTYKMKSSTYNAYSANLRRIIQKYNLDDAVRFAGYVNFEKMPQYYAAADICVVPSAYEPLGNTVLEALASGKPLIASKTGGIQEVVEHMKNGVLVPPKNPSAIADAILKLLEDEDLRKKISANARKKAETMSWDDVAKKMLAIMREIFEKF